MPRSRERFTRALNHWWAGQFGDGSEDWRRERSVEAIAGELRRNAQFELAQASFLHRRPDLATAASVVSELDPPPSPEDAEVLAEAIVRAGTTAQRVRLTTVVGALVTVLALVTRNVLRGR